MDLNLQKDETVAEWEVTPDGWEVQSTRSSHQLQFGLLGKPFSSFSTPCSRGNKEHYAMLASPQLHGRQNHAVQPGHIHLWGNSGHVLSFRHLLVATGTIPYALPITLSFSKGLKQRNFKFQLIICISKDNIQTSKRTTPLHQLLGRQIVKTFSSMWNCIHPSLFWDADKLMSVHVSHHFLYTLPNTVFSAILKAVHDKPQPFLYERNLCRQKWEHQGCCWPFDSFYLHWQA